MRHFTPKEFTCDGLNVFGEMDPELLQMLDNAREMAGVPFVITSSYRTLSHNAKVGGKIHSAHLKGMAVDIAAPNSEARYAMVGGLIKAGFRRIGIGKDFIHTDIDPEKPQGVFWMYGEK
jgi:zinc D-Ala-D-Ala carboxypeptidase